MYIPTVAIIGFGIAGKIHYKNLKKMNANIKYIVDYNYQEIKKSIGNQIRVTSDITDVLDDMEVNAVIICTPTKYHYSQVMSCLFSKKHVFCEKPLSNIENEIKECYQLAKYKNLKLLCALNRRFDPNIMGIKEKINKKEVGKIHNIMTISRDFPYPKLEYLKISSGIFHDCAVNDIDFVNWLLDDKPISVYVTGNIIKPEEIGGNELDNATIIMEYSSGIIATLNLSRISKNYDQRIEVYGENGVIKSDNPYGEVRNNENNPISFPERYAESYKNELNYFFDSIRFDKEIEIDSNVNISNLKIIDACEKSFKSCRKVTVKYGDGFRNYDNVVEAVKTTYLKARKNQTVEYIKRMRTKYLTFNREMSFTDIFSNLEHFVDISDPDISLPNYHHGLQTAEAIRKDGHPDWLQLVGLIHDIGKIIYKWGCDEDGTSLKEQWGIVGDTFIVGCQLPEKIVFPEFNSENPDKNHLVYGSKMGIYSPNCGLDNTLCSWGHDEYLYQILKHNGCKIPDEALYIVRFHSLYSHHKDNQYAHLLIEKDHNMLKWLKLFNKYDLYTKSDITIDNSTKEYYDDLIDKYFESRILKL